jgi:hypothetical protein
LAALSTAFLDAKEEDRMAIRREALDFQALLHAHHTQAPLHAKVARSKGLEDKQGKAVTKALQSHAADGVGDANRTSASTPASPTGNASYANHSDPASPTSNPSDAMGAATRASPTARTASRWHTVQVRWLSHCQLLGKSIAGVAYVMIKSAYFQRFIMTIIVVNSLVMFWNYHSQPIFENHICKRRCDLDSSLPANASSRCSGPLFLRSWQSDGAGGGERAPQKAFCFLADDGACSRHTTRQQCADAVSHLPSALGCYFFAETWKYPSMTVETRPDLASGTDKGECKAGLYAPHSFTHVQGRPISLRQVCGDSSSNEACPAFYQARCSRCDCLFKMMCTYAL